MHFNKQVHLNKFNDNSNNTHNFYNDENNLNKLNLGDQQSSLDYLYQAISIIETKQSHMTSQSNSPTCSRVHDSVSQNFGVESNNYLNSVGK